MLEKYQLLEQINHKLKETVK